MSEHHDRAGGDVGTGWHVPHEQLIEYVGGRIGDSEAWSVETHVTACSRCAHRVRNAVARTLLASRVDAARESVSAQAHQEAQARGRVRTPAASAWSQAWRVLTAGPALRLPWLVATVFVVTLASVLSLLVGEPAQSRPVLLLVAPLLPLTGIALSYGPRVDPAFELTLATPFSGLRLLLVRTVAVLGVSIPLLLIAGFAVPTGGLSSAAWLLPTLTLVLVTLALGSWVEHRLAAVIAGAGWVVAVAGPRLASTAGFSYLFAAPAQVVWAAVALLACGLLFARRTSYEQVERSTW